MSERPNPLDQAAAAFAAYSMKGIPRWKIGLLSVFALGRSRIGEIKKIVGEGGDKFMRNLRLFELVFRDAAGRFRISTFGRKMADRLVRMGILSFDDAHKFLLRDAKKWGRRIRVEQVLSLFPVDEPAKMDKCSFSRREKGV